MVSYNERLFELIVNMSVVNTEKLYIFNLESYYGMGKNT